MRLFLLENNRVFLFPTDGNCFFDLVSLMGVENVRDILTTNGVSEEFRKEQGYFRRMVIVF